MVNIKNKLFTGLIIVIACISIHTIINAKYVINNEFYIANLNIDRTKPIVQILNITNTNSEFEKYANKTHTIKANVKLIEKNIKDVYFDSEHIKVKINENYVSYENIKLNKIESNTNEAMYEIVLNNLNGNGKLKIEILEGTVIDLGELKNEAQEVDTNINIDNTAPVGSFSEEKISDGKVKGIVNSNEKIRDIEGWNMSTDKLKCDKQFTNNISYELPIVDYAGNKSIVEIKITKATYINVIYASHNSEVGWTFGYGNYDIAGKNAVSISPKFKTEGLAFNFSGNIESDFVQSRTYIYTHWGEGTYSKCHTSGIIINHGYNPNDGTYKSMKSTDLVTIDNKKYFQFGGSGLNTSGNTDANGNNPIPQPVSAKYPYGICGIQLKLKSYSEFSVIYQILVDNVGWVASCSDGQECIYSKTKPMSAFRIALIPTSEKQHVIDTWNKDIGTFNLK